MSGALVLYVHGTIPIFTDEEAETQRGLSKLLSDTALANVYSFPSGPSLSVVSHVT